MVVDGQTQHFPARTACVTAITEIQTDEGKLYLCVVLDLFTKLVVGCPPVLRRERPLLVDYLR